MLNERDSDGRLRPDTVDGPAEIGELKDELEYLRANGATRPRILSAPMCKARFGDKIRTLRNKKQRILEREKRKPTDAADVRALDADISRIEVRCGLIEQRLGSWSP